MLLNVMEFEINSSTTKKLRKSKIARIKLVKKITSLFISVLLCHKQGIQCQTSCQINKNAGLYS